MRQRTAHGFSGRGAGSSDGVTRPLILVPAFLVGLGGFAALGDGVGRQHSRCRHVQAGARGAVLGFGEQWNSQPT